MRDYLYWKSQVIKKSVDKANKKRRAAREGCIVARYEKPV